MRFETKLLHFQGTSGRKPGVLPHHTTSKRESPAGLSKVERSKQLDGLAFALVHQRGEMFELLRVDAFGEEGDDIGQAGFACG